MESPLNVTATSPDSTESSVEGIFVSGVRSPHPFKVVESDSRSVQSETRSASRSASGVALDSVEQMRNSQDLFLTPPPVLTKVKVRSHRRFKMKRDLRRSWWKIKKTILRSWFAAQPGLLPKTHREMAVRPR